MSDRYVSAIRGFSEEVWFEPEAHWPKYWFDQRAYSRWAAMEVLHLLRSREDKSPVSVVQKFIKHMDYLSCIKPETREMFVFAREAGVDMLDVIRAMGND